MGAVRCFTPTNLSSCYIWHIPLGIRLHSNMTLEEQTRVKIEAPAAALILGSIKRLHFSYSFFRPYMHILQI